MDEEDFRDRPRSKKRRDGISTWAKDLLGVVRVWVLRETDDFVLKQNLATSLNHSEAAIGSCLAALIREGILTPLRPVEPHEHIRVGDESCFWQNGQWMVRGNKSYSTRMHPVRGIRRKTKIIKNKATPDTKAEWDGRANFIIRGTSVFRKACKEAGFPENPVADWFCPQCSWRNKHTELNCHNYKNHCLYKRPHLRFWPVPVKYDVCGRCGVKLEKHARHKVHACNTAIVKDIMET